MTEHEAELVNRLIEAYPAGLGYTMDRDPPMRELAAELVAEGRVQRKEIVEDVGPLVFYRLTDEHAEEIRRIAKERARHAKDN